MADAVDPTTPAPDGASGTSDDVATKLQAKIDELTAALDIERRRSADAVDDAKKEREKRKKDAEAKGDFEKVKAEYEAQLAEYNGKLAELETLKVKAAQADELIEEQRKQLLDKLPQDKRDMFKDDSLESLRKVAALLPAVQAVDTDAARRAAGPDGQSKNWYDMTENERAAWSNGKLPEQLKAKIAGDWKLKSQTK